MAEKLPLDETHPSWRRSAIGWVTCYSCGWHGRHSSLLSEKSSHRLYCPLCTSTRWIFAKRKTIHE